MLYHLRAMMALTVDPEAATLPARPRNGGPASAPTLRPASERVDRLVRSYNKVQQAKSLVDGATERPRSPNGSMQRQQRIKRELICYWRIFETCSHRTVRRKRWDYPYDCFIRYTMGVLTGSLGEYYASCHQPKTDSWRLRSGYAREGAVSFPLKGLTLNTELHNPDRSARRHTGHRILPGCT